MDWETDLSKLRHRRNNLLALIAAIEARDVIAARKGKACVSGNGTDLAKLKADLTEIDDILHRVGETRTAWMSSGKEAVDARR